MNWKSFEKLSDEEKADAYESMNTIQRKRLFQSFRKNVKESFKAYALKEFEKRRAVQ